MNAVRTTLLVALAAVVLIGTGAAAGAVAATPNSGGAGPPSDLPDQVPEFVGGILDSVTEFLDGGVDDLGATVSEIAGNAPGERGGPGAEGEA